MLVLSPHPDDEAIGCGGTLRKHVLEGHAVFVVFLTSGEAGGHGIEDAGETREREAEASASILGLTDIEFWRLGDGQVRAVGQTVDRLAKHLTALDPDFVYVTHDREMHPDHRASGRILRAAVAKTGMSSLEVRTYEVWTPMQEMAYIEDITDVMDTKLQAVQAYQSQCRIMRFDDAIKGLNRYRGEMHSWPGGDYAEVFGDLRT